MVNGPFARSGRRSSRVVGTAGARARCRPAAAATRPWPERQVKAGFSLVEAIIALVLLGAGAVAAATAEAWAARTLALAEAREEAAAGAVRVLDSLVQARLPASGSASDRGITLDWNVSGTAGSGLVVIRATAAARALPLDESFGVALRAPPPFPGAAP